MYLNKMIVLKMLILWKLMAPILFFLVSISLMAIVSQSFLYIRRFWFYGNQPFSAINCLLDSTPEDEFNQALLISGIISVGISFISPTICLIQCVSISCFVFRYEFCILCSVLFSLLPDTMMFYTEHPKQWFFLIIITYIY